MTRVKKMKKKVLHGHRDVGTCIICLSISLRRDHGGMSFPVI